MSQDNSIEGQGSRGIAILGMVVTFLGGYVLGSMRSGAPQEVKDPADTARKPVAVGASPAKGPDDALVTIIEFADFQCGFCRRSVPLQRRLLREYGGRVRWVFKHMPLSFHRRARPAAIASMAAAAQGRFWEYHDLLFLNSSRMDDAHFLEHARTLDLDLARFKEDLANDQLDAAVSADIALANQVGVKGTPNFFINGRRVVGAPSYGRLKRIVREEIAYAKQLISRGATPGEVYGRLTGVSGTADEVAANPGQVDDEEAGAGSQPASAPANAPRKQPATDPES